MPDGEKYLDPVAFAITGLDRAQAAEEGYKVKPMTLEESWNLNKHAVEGQMNFEQFSSLYNNVYGEESWKVQQGYLDMATGKQKYGDNIYFDNKQAWPVNPAILGIETPQKWEIFQSDNKATKAGMYYDRQGRLEDTYTDEERASSRGNYYIPNPLKETGYDVGDLADYDRMNHQGYPFRYDENGNKKMLVLDPVSKIWVERDADAVVAGDQLRSIWNDRKAESGTWENAATTFANTMRDQAYNSAGTVAETAATFNDWIFGKSKTSEKIGRWGREMQNYGNAVKSKVSEAVQQEGMFGSWRATVGTATGALTQVGTQALVGLMTRGVGNVVLGGAKGIQAFNYVSKALGATKAGTFAKNRIKNSINGLPWAWSAAYAMNGMNEEAKAAGLDAKSRAIMSTVAGASVFASEYALKALGGKGLVDLFDDPMMAREASKKIQDGLRNIATQAKSEVSEGMTKKAIQEVTEKRMDNLITSVAKDYGIDTKAKTFQNALKNIKNKVVNWQYSDKPGSMAARVFRAGMPAGFEEAGEETLEGGINSFAKYVYNEGFADPNASAGRGKFHSTAWEHPLGEATAGFIGGFPMGFIIGARKRVNLKDYGVAEIAMNMDYDQGQMFLKKMYDKGMLGNPMVDTQGQFMESLPEKERKNAKTMNDEAYDQLKEQLDIAYKIKDTLRLTDASTLNDVMGGDMALAKDALVERMKQVRYQAEIADLKKEMLNTELTDAEKQNLQKQLDEIQVLNSQSKQLSDDIISGKAVEKYKAIMAVRAAEVKRYAAINASNDILNDKKEDNYITKAIEDLKETDDWQSRESAIEKIKIMQGISDSRKEKLAEFEAAKEESDTLKNVLDGLGVKDVKSLDDKGLRASVDAIVDHLKNSKALYNDHKSTMSSLSSQLSERANQLTSEILGKSKYAKDGIDTVYDLKKEEYLSQQGKEEKDLTKAEKEKLRKEAEKDFLVEMDQYKDMGVQDAIDLDNEINDAKDYVDTYKGLIKDAENQMVQDSDIEYSFSPDNLFDENRAGEGVYVDAMEYTKTDADGKITKIDQDDFVDAKAMARSKENSFEHDGFTYQATPKKSRNGFRKIVKSFPVRNEDGSTENKIAEAELVNISSPGKKAYDDLELESKLRTIRDNYKQQGEATEGMIQEMENILEQSKKVKEAIDIMSMVSREGFSGGITDWLGFDNKDGKLTSDLYAISDRLDYIESTASAAIGDMKSNLNIRESQMAMYDMVTIKHKAHMHNKLLDYMSDKKVVIDGVVMNTPLKFENLDDLNEANVAKAMQYWHYYFKMNDATDARKIIDDFKYFWHNVVEEKTVDENKNFLNTPKHGLHPSNVQSEKQGMFVDNIESYLDFELFNNQDKSKPNNFKMLAYYHYLNTIFNVDPVKIYSSFSNSLEGFDKAHTPEQVNVIIAGMTHLEENARLQQARQLNDKEYLDYHDAFKAIMKVGAKPPGSGESNYSLYQLNPTQLSAYNDPNVKLKYGVINPSHVKDNVLYVPGAGGVGKTSYAVRTISEYADQFNLHNGEAVILVAPNKNQLQGLIDAAKDAGINFEAMVTSDFIKDQQKYENRIMFIDEVSLMTEPERGALYYNGDAAEIETGLFAYEQYKLEDGNVPLPISNTNTIFFLGDESQAPYDPVRAYSAPPFTRHMQHTFNMTQVKRTEYVDIFAIQNIFRSMIAKGFYASLPKLDRDFYYARDENGNHYGVNPIDNEADFFEHAKRVNTLPDGKGYVVVMSEEDADKVEAFGINKDKIKVLQTLERSPQGATINEVYVYIPTDNIVKPNQQQTQTQVELINFAKYMGTAVGRGKNYVSIYTSKDKKRSMSLGTSKKVDVKSLEKFESNSDLDQNKLNSLKARMNNIHEELKNTTPTIQTSIFNNTNKETQGEGTNETDNNEPTGSQDNTENTDDQDAPKPDPDDIQKRENEYIVANANRKQHHLAGNKYTLNGIDYVMSNKSFTSKDDYLKTGEYFVYADGETNNNKKYRFTWKFEDNQFKLKDRTDITPSKDEEIENQPPAGDIDENDYDNQNDGGSNDMDPSIIENVNPITDPDGKITGLTFGDTSIKIGTELPLKNTDTGKIVINGFTYDEKTGIYKVKGQVKGARSKIAGAIKKGIGLNMLSEYVSTFSDQVDNKSDVTLSQYLNSGVLRFTNRYARHNGKTFIQEQKETIGKVINLLTLSPRPKFVIKIANGAPIIDERGNTSNAKYALELYYKDMFGKEVYAGIIPVYENSKGKDNLYGKLYDEVETKLANGENVFAEGQIDAKTQFNPNTSVKTRLKKKGRSDADQIINDIRNIYGNQIERIKLSQKSKIINEGTPEQTAIMSSVLEVKLMGDLGTINISLEAKNLQADNVRAKEYIENLISELKSAQTQGQLQKENALKNVRDKFFDYNASQMYSDSKQAIAPTYIKDLQKKKLLVEKEYQGKKSLNIKTDGTINENISNLLAALEIIKNNIGTVAKIGKLRFAPRFVGGNLSNPGDFTTANENYISMPFIDVDIRSNKDGTNGLNKTGDIEREQQYYRKTAEQTYSIFDEILGNVDPELTQGLYEGEGAHGKLTKVGKILLNFRDGLVNERAIYHEMAHYVLEFLVPADIRKAVYQEAARKTGLRDFDYDDVQTRKKLAEAFADMAERYAYDRRNVKGISKIFKRVLDYIKYVFSKMGVLKNLTHEYMYDIYINKSYRADDSNSIAPIVDEMPYDDLFMKSKTYRPFSVVENHFGDRNVAIEASDNMAKFMSYQTTMPVLNNRLFKDKRISFNDVLNRIEYNMRQKVMYQTDIDGNILYHETGDLKGYPILRTVNIGGFENTPLQILVKDESFDLFRYKTDDNGNVNLQYFHRKKKKYVNAPQNNKGIYFPKGKNRTHIRKEIKNALKDFTIESHDDMNPYPTLFSDNREEKQALNVPINQSDKVLIHAAAAMDDSIFIAMMNRYFPNIDVGGIMSGKKVNVKIDQLVNDMIMKTDSVAKRESNQVNPMDRMSDMMKFILMTSPKYDFDVASQEWVPTSKKLNLAIASSALVRLNMTQYSPSMNSLEMFKMSLDNEMAKLASIDEEGAANNENYIVYRSLYEQFFNENYSSMSHMSILNMYSRSKGRKKQKKAAEYVPVENIYNMQYIPFFQKQQQYGWIDAKEEPLSLKDFDKFLYNRAKHSAKILNAFATHFGSMGRDNYKIMKMWGSESNAFISIRNLDDSSINEKKLELEHHFASSIMPEGGEIKQGYANLFGFNDANKVISPKGYGDPFTRFKDDGIYYFSKRDNKEYKIINILAPMTEGEPYRITAISEQENQNLKNENVDKAQMIKSVLGEVFNYNMKSYRALNQLAFETNSEQMIGWNNFHEVFGPLMLSIYTHTAENYYGENVTDSGLYNVYYSAVDSFKDGNYGKLTVESLESLSNKNDDGSVTAMQAGDLNEGSYHPNGFHNELVKFANVLAEIKSSYTYNAKGKKIHLETSQDMMGYRFNDGGEQMATTYEEEMENGLTAFNPNNRGDEVFNPLFVSRKRSGNPNNFIKGLEINAGIKKGFSGSDLTNLTARDNFDYMYQTFIKDLNASPSGWTYKNVYIPFFNQGDRNRQRDANVDFTVNGYTGDSAAKNSNGLMYMDSKGDVHIDSHNVMHHVANTFKIYEEAQVNSINRWIDFILKDQGKALVYSTTEFINETSYINTSEAGWRDKRKSVLKTLRKALANYQFEVAGDEVANFDGTSLKQGVDYLIVKNNDGSVAKIFTGHDTNMNSSIYLSTPEGYVEKKTPISIFNNDNYHKLRPIKVKDKTYIKTSISKLLESQDSNGDMYITYKSKGITQQYKLTEADKRKMLFSLFGKDLKEVNRITAESGYRIFRDELPNNRQALMKEDSRAGITTAKGKYDESWAALTMGHTIMNEFYALSTEGTYAMEMDNVLYTNDKNIGYSKNGNKRGMQLSSPMTNVQFEGDFGMDASGLTVTIGEVMTEAGIEGYNSVFKQGHSVFDGQTWENPLQSYMRFVAAGGENSNFNKEGAMKTVSTNYDRMTGQSAKHKHSKSIFSYQSMMLAPNERKIFEIMLNPRAKKYVPDYEVMNTIRNYSDIDGNNDSLWQRYLVYEQESKYVDAVNKMKGFIESRYRGGLEGYLKNLNFDQASINSMVSDFDDEYTDVPLYVQHENLSMLMNMAGDQDYIVKPENNPVFENAIELLADFYYKERANGNRANYPFIGQIVQKDASRKEQAIGNSMPIIMTGGMSNNIRPLRHLAAFTTNEKGEQIANVPTNFFSMYDMHLESTNDLDESLYTEYHDNTQEGMQMNANTNIDDTSESPMVQMMAIILAAPEQHNNGQAKKMVDAMAKIIRVALMKFNKMEDVVRENSYDLGEDSNDVVSKFVKSQIQKAMTGIDDGSMLSAILANDNINLGVSEGLQERVYQYLSSFFRKEIVKRKQEAMRLIQIGGNNIKLYRYKKPDGTTEIFNVDDAVIYATRMLGADFIPSDSNVPLDVEEVLKSVGFEVSGLKHTTIDQGRVMTQEQEAEAQREYYRAYDNAVNAGYDVDMADQIGRQMRLRYMIDNDFAVVRKGEAVLPASKFTKYGIPKDMRMNQLYRLYEMQDGKYVDLELMKLSRGDTLDELKANRKQLINVIKEYVSRNLSFNVKEHRGQLKAFVQYRTDENGDAVVNEGDNTYFDVLFKDSTNEYLKDNSDEVKAIREAVNEALFKKHGNKKKFLSKYFVDGKPTEEYYNEVQADVDKLFKQELEGFLGKLTKKMADGLIATMQAAQEGVGVRTPSGPGSGFINTVVQFVNDNGSVGYVNTIKNLIDGSDQDIDQFTFYYRSDTMNALGYSADEEMDTRNMWNENKNVEAEFDEDLNNLNNELIDLLFDYFKNPKNNHLTGSAINMDPLKYVASKAETKKFPNGDMAHNLGQNIIYRRASFDGKVVGPFAQAQKVQTFLFSGFQLNNGRTDNNELMNFSKYPFLLDASSYRDVPGRVEGAVNGATDNPKLFVIGNMNISFLNADMIGASLLAPQELIDFVVSNPTDFDMTREEVLDMQAKGKNDELLYTFFQGQAHSDLFNFTNKQNDKRSKGYMPSFYKAAYTYLNDYDKKKEDRKVELAAAETKILSLRNQIQNLVMDITGMDEAEYNNIIGKYPNAMRVLKGMSKKSTKKVHIEAADIIEKTLKGQLTSTDNDQLKAEIEDALTNLYSVDGKMEMLRQFGAVTESAETWNSKSDVATEKLAELSKAIKALQNNENVVRKIGNKASDSYGQQLGLLAKYAMLGEWMRNTINIADIDQYKITSIYDAYRYLRNLEYMTGHSPTEIKKIHKAFTEYKKTYPNATPKSFFSDPSTPYNGYKSRNAELNARRMRKHELAGDELKHYKESISFINGNGNIEEINYFEDFFQIGDVLSMVLARNDIMERINVLLKQEEYKAMLFKSHHPVFNSLLKDRLLEDTAQDTINERKFRTYYHEVNQLLTGMFFEENVDVQRKFYESLKAMNIDGPLIGDKNIGFAPNIEDAMGRKRFIEEFPIFFETTILPELNNYIANNPKLENTPIAKFINSLHVVNRNSMSFIELKQRINISPDEQVQLREGFNALPAHIRDLTAIYQLTKTGFEYQKGFLAKVVPEHFYEDYSAFLDNVDLSKIDLQKFSMQFLANPSKGFARNQVRTKVTIGGKTKTIQTPPIGAHGPAKFSIKEIDRRYRKGFRASSIKVLAKTIESDNILFGESGSRVSTANNVPYNEILDIKETPVYMPKSYTIEGVKLDLEGINLGAYLNMFVKGGFERRVANEIKRQTPPGVELTQKEKADIVNDMFDIADWNTWNFDTTRGKIEELIIDNEKESYAEAVERVSNEWVQIVSNALYANYSNDPVGFNDMVEDLKGKTIVGPKIKNQQAMPYLLSKLFNYLQAKAKDGDYYSLLGNPILFSELENVAIESNEEFYRNRITDLGVVYDKQATDAHITKMKVGNHNAYLETLAEGLSVGTDRFNADRDFASVVVRSWYNDYSMLDVNTNPNLNQKIYFDASVTGRELGQRIVNNMDVWVEHNVPFSMRQKHLAMIDSMKSFGKDAVLNNVGNFSNKVVRTHTIPFKVGDIIQFSDSTEGVVTNIGDPIRNEFGEVTGYRSYTYVLNPEYKVYTKTYRSVARLEDQLDNNNARRSLESIARLISKGLPNVQYQFINNAEAEAMGEFDSNSFFKNGKVYINLDKADRGVVLHEFAHPFTLALESENKPLYDALAEQVKYNNDLMQFVTNNYPELETEAEIVREAIPTYLQMRFYARERGQLTQEQSDTWDSYFEWIRSTFKTAMSGTPNIETSLNNISISDATLNDFADAMLNDLLSGAELSKVTSSELSHMMPYTMKAVSTSKVKNINIDNIRRLFQVKADYTSNEEARQTASAIINNARSEGSTYKGQSGTYYFNLSNPAFLTNGLFDQGKYDKYVSNAIAKEAAFFSDMNSKALEFFEDLSAGNNVLESAMNNIYSSWKRRYKLEEMTDAEIQGLEDRVNKMLNHVGFDPNTDLAMTIDDAALMLKVQLPKNIRSEAIVIVHDAGKPAESLSILSMKSIGLGKTGASDKKILGDAFRNKEDLSRKDRRKFRDITLTNTNQDIQALQNALVGMAFTKAGKKIRKVGSIRVTGENYYTHFKQMSDMIGQIEKLFNLNYFAKESLERDLYDLVNDVELYSEDLYRRPVLETLSQYIDTELAQSKDEKDIKSLTAAKEILAHVIEDDLQMKAPALARAVLARLKYIKYEVLGGDPILVAENEEFQMLANAYMQLTSYDDINVKKTTPISFDEEWLDTADRWHGQVRTWVFDSLDTNLRQSKEQMLPFQEKINELTKAMNKQNPELGYFKDGAHKLFKNLFKKRTALDLNGNEVEISTHEIHYTLEDAETKALYDAKKITDTELAFGSWLADQLYEEFVQYTMILERGSIQNGPNESEEELRAKAVTRVNYRYKKGMMPVFQRTFGAALSEGGIKEAMDIWLKTAGRWYGGNLYEDYAQSDAEGMQKEKFKKLLSPFWNQFNNSAEYGGEQRLHALGLGQKSIKKKDADGIETEESVLVLLEPERQKQLSFNLTNIGLFTKGASTRARFLKDGVTKVNVALDILRGEKHLKGINTDGIIRQLEGYVNRQVYGNLPQLAKLHAFGAVINLDNLLDGTGQLLNSIHLALNPMLGAKNFAAAAFKTLANSVTNALSGSSRFNPQNVLSALYEVVANPKKVEALNRMYQVVNVSERDVLNHFRNNITKRNFTETDMQMIFHFFGDHFTQLVGFVAQMKKEGTWDAHSYDKNTGEITYDVKKDKRFYEVRQGESSGVFTADGELLLNDLMKQQIKEEYHVPGKSGPTHAYSQRDENRLKIITNRFIGELSDPQYKNAASNISLARSFMSMKNWMYNVKQFWWKNRAPEVGLGDRVVKEFDGVKKVVWEPEMTEGVFQTMVYMVKQLKNGEKLEMDEYRKRNLLAMAVTFMMLGGIYYVVDLLTDGFDDDDDKRTEEDESLGMIERKVDQLVSEPTGYNITKDSKDLAYWQKLVRYIIGAGASEMLSYARPWQLYNEFNRAPNTYWWQIQNVADAIMATFTLPMDMKTDGTTAIDEFFYKLSRNIPLGSNYRNIRNMIYNILDDYQTVTKK